MKKVLAIFIMIFMLVGSLTACDGGSKGIFYLIHSDNTCSVMRDESVDPKRIEIPSTYEGNQVVSIVSEGFMGTSAKEAIIPEGVMSIGDRVFCACAKLKRVTIPNSVTFMGDFVFRGCDALKGNKYDNAIYLGNSENRYLYLHKAESNDITSVSINESTRFIGSEAFYDCQRITSVAIPNSVTILNANAFYGCKGLTSISISNGVRRLHSKVFYDCISLDDVTVPSSVTMIGASAFENCNGLTNVTFEITEGWKCFKDEGNSDDGISISSADLADPEIAAKYLSDTYSGYYWYRN